MRGGGFRKREVSEQPRTGRLGERTRGVRRLQDGDPRRLGRWRLTERIGSGGMGRVFLGDADGRLAAVKTIAPHLAADPEFRARFRREVAICARVTGAQVAELYEADADAAVPWLAVRYVPGPTLNDAVTQGGPLRGPTLIGFAVAILEALRQIHGAGVTHRDLKPSNVMLTPESPVIVDFGIARAVDGTAVTAAGHATGSAGWMAPEQILGHPSGPAADVFSWASVVAYAATGPPPFGTGPADALAYRVVHETPDLRGVPAELLSTLTTALTADPAGRPTIEDLVKHLSGDPSATRAPDTIRTAWQEDPTTKHALTAV